MCGIAGILETAERPVDRATLLSMAGELHHRGPDGTGIYRDGPFGMVNTRLAIVDLAGGDQPIPNETRNLWVVQNGEIYNHIELRAELGSLGHRFETTSDTEVIVHAFEQWGAACLEHFNGPFAFAIWDRGRRELFLARDRLGIRPLFLANCRGTLVFGSEGKALLRYPAMARALDPLGVAECFAHWGASFDHSALGGIRELPPGHYLTVGPHRVEERRWYDLPFEPGLHDDTKSREDFADELLSLLEDSVRLRLRADVPVGVYLSGGLDSSATTALVQRLNRKGLRSFALRFDDPLFDESAYQELMARQLDTELSSVSVSARSIAEALPDVIRHAERPLLRTAPAPLLRLAGHVHEHDFRVVLTGEGADELFAGYNIFKEAKVRRFWARQPDSECRPRLLGRLYPYLARDLTRGAEFTAAFFRGDLLAVDDPLYSHRIRFQNGHRLVSLLTEECRAAFGGTEALEQRLIAALPERFLEYSPLNRAQWLEIRTFLQGYLLHAQGDRMLMGHCVEGRFPYLDHRLLELAARIPDRVMLPGLREKAVLKSAVGSIVPREIVSRPKQPYRAPILQALIGPNAPDIVRDCFEPEAIARTQILDGSMASRVIGKCRSRAERGVGETDEMALVAILSTVLLHRGLVERPDLAMPREPGREVQGGTVLPSAGAQFR